MNRRVGEDAAGDGAAVQAAAGGPRVYLTVGLFRGAPVGDQHSDRLVDHRCDGQPFGRVQVVGEGELVV